MNPLYLSRLVLNPRQRQVQYALADCRRMHQSILHAFPDDPSVMSARAHFGVLYRVESGVGFPTLLVQSQMIPDWSRLDEAWFAQPPNVRRVDPLYTALAVETVCRFRLRANPTKRISQRNSTQDPRWRGKRVELRSEHDQLAWLQHQGTRHGFSLLSVREQVGLADLLPSDPQTLHGSRPQSAALTLGTVLLEGYLRIEDTSALQAALLAGIGPGKAFGCGLLSLVPLPSPGNPMPR